VQKAQALLPRSSCASTSRTALCASLALRRLPLRAPDASLSLPVLYFSLTASLMCNMLFL
jgi:hypothetical protein